MLKAHARCALDEGRGLKEEVKGGEDLIMLRMRKACSLAISALNLLFYGASAEFA
jgi:hypothetical protein